ncbi:protein LURP-one-related 4 [Euphorbia lathyris]|uniref:protein LURP-one-related 4 n=1 Tax=Euphorbia lathyris TaxID=212925 RepID=UPI00331404F6
MAKIFPQKPIISSANFNFMTIKKETYTVWMKSLVCHTNGCTIFDSNGNIVYRVENYDHKSSNEVFLMDLRGRVIVTIRRKRLLVFRRWYGYRWNVENKEEEEPWFEVRRDWMRKMGCEVRLGFDKYWIVNLGQKDGFRIVDFDGDLIAEVKQKQTASGYGLGDDVLSLIVEPHIDHLFIIAILIVYGLINNIL